MFNVKTEISTKVTLLSHTVKRKHTSKSFYLGKVKRAKKSKRTQFLGV